MKKRDYLFVISAGFVHCIMFWTTGTLPDFVLPENMEISLLSATILVGTAACVFFNFYKLRSVKQLVFRMVVLYIGSFLCLALLGRLEIAQALSAWVPLRDIDGENFAAMAAFAFYTAAALYACVLSFVVYLIIKLCKWVKQRRYDT